MNVIYTGFWFTLESDLRKNLVDTEIWFTQDSGLHRNLVSIVFRVLTALFKNV
jgi:hypothetical protein